MQIHRSELMDHLTEFVQLEKKRLMGVLSIYINTLCVGIKEERDKEFSLVEIEKSEGNQHKLKGNKFHSNLWKKNSLSTVMLSKHWNTLTVGLCCLHPQRCTKYSWAQPTATCPSWPYTEQRHYTHSSEITSKLLWFCENLEPMDWRVQRYFSHINSL